MAGNDEKDVFGPDYGHQRIRFHKDDEVNPYADAEDERLGLDPRAKKVIGLAIATVAVFFFSATLPTNVFSFYAHPDGYTPADFVAEYPSMLEGFVAFLTGQTTLYTTYAWQVLACVLAGAALGLSGGVYQGALKNALASPSTLGVTSGGSLGLIIYGLFMYNGSFSGSVEEYSAYLEQLGPLEYVFETFGSFLGTLIGCFAIVCVILLIAHIAGRGHVTNVSLIIAGQVLGAVVTVAINWLRYYLVYYQGNSDMEELIINAQSTSFTGVYTLTTVAVFAVPLIACMAYVFASSGRLSLLAFSDDEARSMGISTARTRNLLVAVCTAMTALVISFTGPLGFVGFMVPHIARRITGPEFRYLLPACAFLGAMLVAAVHYISYLGIPGIPIGSTGMFTSIVGCVMFIVMALRSRGAKHAEWF